MIFYLNNIEYSCQHVTCRFVDLFPLYCHEQEIINSSNCLSTCFYSFCFFFFFLKKNLRIFLKSQAIKKNNIRLFILENIMIKRKKNDINIKNFLCFHITDILLKYYHKISQNFVQIILHFYQKRYFNRYSSIFWNKRLHT